MRTITTRQGIYGPSVDRPDEDLKRNVSQSVRNARVRLTSAGPLKPNYRYELLYQFAHNQLGVAVGLPLLAVVVAGIMHVWLPLPAVAMWLASVLAAKGVVLTLCRVFTRLSAEKADTTKWNARFMAAELLYGWSWASLIVICVRVAPENQMPFIMAFVALVVMMALRSMMAGSLAAVVHMCTAPVTAALLFSFVSLDDTIFYALGAVAVCAQYYFFLVSRRQTQNLIETIELRVQKDALIAELEQAKAISDEARRRAESANIAKSRFLATMSHELRTPLNAILGFSEVMKSEILGPHSVPTYQEYSADIHRSGEHLLHLISEVLDLSRIEAGRYELQEEPVSLAGVVDDCMRLMELRARERGVKLEEHVEPDMPDIWADERAVRQVCLNLVSNSIKFTPNGGHIVIKAGWTEAGGQYLCVKDTGPGIPEDEIPQILTSFGQGSLAQKTAEQGAGLGLPIVQGLIDLHGGTFELKSKLREGTTVTVIFPPKRILSEDGQRAVSAA